MGFLEKRLEKLVEKIAVAQLDGLLVTNLTNIFYLTGFSGTAATVFVSANERLFLTDSRYTLMAKDKVKGFEIIETRDPLSALASLLQGSKVRRIGFDDQVSFAYYQSLLNTFSKQELIPQTQLIESIRQIKDEQEIALIKGACQISDQAFIDLLEWIKVGQTEIEVANFLDFRMRELGASGVSFETIVASGQRSAMPHGVASEKTLAFGDAVTLDFGCFYQHYASDMTRTIYLGQVSEEEEEIYQTVLSANQTLIEKAKAGLSFAEYDGIPRQIITDAGYGPYFSHGIGHGLGLDIHEIPFFSQKEEALQPGMVVTDEPGIYLDNQYGVRIEDDLWIRENGCDILTQAPKELLIIK